MKRKFASLMIICMMFSMVGMTGCNKDTVASLMGEEEPTFLIVDVVSPQIMDIGVTGEYVGTLEYENLVSVIPMMSGEVTATYFEEGDYVNEGDLLFTIDDDAYQLQMRNAQITYQQAQTGVSSQLGQLQMGRDSAYNSVASAREGISQIQDSYDYMTDQLADLTETRADLAEQRAELKDNLNEVREQIHDAEKELENAQREYNHEEDVLDELKAQNSPMAVQQEMILNSLSMSVAGAQTKLSALKQAETQLVSAITQMDSSLDQLDSSKETLENQRDNLDYNLSQAQRGEQLAEEQLQYYDSYTVPSAEASAETTMQQAQLGIDSARMQLNFTRVTAPVSGTIMTKSVEELGMAQVGYPAYVIISDDGAIASFGVPESTFRMLSVGQSVSVERNGVVYEGNIVELPLQVNQQTGLFTIKAALKGNTEDLIMGTSVKVTLVTRHAENTITIPIDCVYYESGQAYTYALEGNIVRKIFVETGLYDDVNMQILDGVTEDMRIITTWSSDLRDGLEVRTETVAAE